VCVWKSGKFVASAADILFHTRLAPLLHHPAPSTQGSFDEQGV